jgi:Pyruvate/2-oxoacid:ferredoxin oxidoreductase delta subunit
MSVTTMSEEAYADVAACVDAPSFIVPWLSRFYEPEDIRLIATVAGDSGISSFSAQAVARAIRRAVLDYAPNGGYLPASFHKRYEIWALFEGYTGIPSDVRRALNEWELDDYLLEVGPGIQNLAKGGPENSDQSDYTFLLLEEAEEMLRSLPRVYLWPCNCRAMWGNCSHSHSVCLRFENDRDIGWELTPERAVEILRQADSEGLMHTAYTNSRHGHHGICNCCADCCFPILAGKRLGAAELWPVRRHRAAVDPEACRGCRDCLSRCPFGALTMRKGVDRTPQLDAHACRGCGLCSTGCPQNAIEMQPLPRPGLSLSTG